MAVLWSRVHPEVTSDLQFDKIAHYEREQLTLLNSANLETVWRTNCSGQFYHISLFGKFFYKSLGMGSDLHLISS